MTLLGLIPDKPRSKRRRIYNKIKSVKYGLLGHKTSDHAKVEKMHKKSLQEVLSHPFQEKAVLECLYNMLSSPQHPYGMVVADVGRKLITAFEQGDDKEQILADVKIKLDSFSESMAIAAFQQIKKITLKISYDDFTVLCRDAIYEVLLSNEPNVIFDYYHIKFTKQDSILCFLSDKVADRLAPVHLEIPQKFWLIPKNSPKATPYKDAISAFQQFPNQRSPMQKVAVLKETARKICDCVEHFWNVNRTEFTNDEDPAIAADDLVSIFCYVILKSRVHLVFSESEYIGDYISDRNLMGETGYLITTFQCCCHVLESMDPEELLKDN